MIDFPEVKPEYIEYLLCYIYTCDFALAWKNLVTTRRPSTADKFALLELADKYLFGQLKDYWCSQLSMIVQSIESQIFKSPHSPLPEGMGNTLIAFVRGSYGCEIPAGEGLREQFVSMAQRSPLTLIDGKKFIVVVYERAIRATPKAGLDIITAFSKEPSGQLLKVFLENLKTLEVLTEDVDFLLQTLGAITNEAA